MGQISELVTLLDLEAIEDNLYRGQSEDIGGVSVFGGQVVSQALVAAVRTLESERLCHSLHAYFLRPGDMYAPIVYEVDRIRDGNSFTTRRVVAIQHGEAIFSMSCSFHKPEQGFEHQATDIPKVPSPDTLEPEIEWRQRSKHRVPEQYHEVFLREAPIEIRHINPVDMLEPEPRHPRKQVWFRSNGKLNDDLTQHQAVLAYASDFGLLGTGMMPHGIAFLNPQVRAASLDHALWFHHPFRADDWLLYDMESPVAASSRGFNRGLIYNQQGQLVVSVVQEGLMRMRRS